MRRRRRGAFSGPEGSWWLFLVPSALVLRVMLYPLGYAIWLSLFNYDLGSGAPDFIGLGNYAALLATRGSGIR